MESLGKEMDINNRLVNQGLTVYGNKGSTDQHAYIQQLRDGPNNFIVTFIEVLKDREDASVTVEPDITSGDYLLGFLLGTRQALYDKDRESITLTIAEVSAFTVGVLIALYERAVGFYATLVGVNAYHQPGVEGGKRAAEFVISVQREIQSHLQRTKARPQTATQIAAAISALSNVETVFKVCEHLANNPDRGIRRIRGTDVFSPAYERV